jgi:hypothetical protein
MTTTEEKIIKLRNSNPNATLQQIADDKAVKRSKEYIRRVLGKNGLPTANALRGAYKPRCPECGSQWLRISKKLQAWECRTCGCYFTVEGNMGRVMQHGKTQAPTE